MTATEVNRLLETGAATLVFSAVFLGGGRFYPGRLLTRNQGNLLSASAGISLAYVFVHMMPELSNARQTFVKWTSLPTEFDGMVVYFLALLGFLIFFSLDRYSQRSVLTPAVGGIPDFNIKVVGFSAYVCLVSYLLINNLESSLLASATYAVAMSVHFLMFDHGFREEPGDSYQKHGHLLLAAAAPVGWGLGLMFALPQDILALMLGFLSGGVIVNSMIAELPANGDTRPLWPFLSGSIAYSLILVTLR